MEASVTFCSSFLTCTFYSYLWFLWRDLKFTFDLNVFFLCGFMYIYTWLLMHWDAIIDRTNTCVFSLHYGLEKVTFTLIMWISILVPSFISTFTPKILFLEIYVTQTFFNDFWFTTNYILWASQNPGPLWQVIEKLSIRPPSGEVKLKLMKDIASELNVDWDPTTSESELLKAPEDLLVSIIISSHNNVIALL